MDTLVSQTESTRAREVENVVVQAFVREHTEGLVCKVILLDGELVEAHQAQEVAEEKFCSLSDAWADGARSLVVSEMERWEQLKELSLLQAWGVELCLAIAGPSQVRSHLSVRMQATALRDIEMVMELTALRAVVSSAAELVLGHSPNETLMWKLHTSSLPNSGGGRNCARGLRGLPISPKSRKSHPVLLPRTSAKLGK
jgi:phosphoribosyl-dephospho-CoA transferase